MKIAIITSGFLPAIDGVTVTLWKRLQWLSQRGHEVLVFCPDYRAIAPIYPNWSDYVGEILPGVRVISLESEPFMGVEFERNSTRKSYPMMRRMIEQFQPDMIHVDEPDRLFLGMLKAPGVDVARRDRIPCVGFFHTNFVQYIEDYAPLPRAAVRILEWISTQIIRRVFNAYDGTLVASEVALQNARRLGIRNAVYGDFLGVDIAQFRPELREPRFFETHYGLADVDQRVKLVFLGRLTPDKGWRLTQRVLSQLAEIRAFRETAMLIAGDGELRDDLKATVQTLGLNVHFLGRVPPDAVPALLVNSDIHVTASEKETLGLTVLEAFAAGIPAIAPRAGGVVNTIRDGWNGLLFTPGDAADFGQTLMRLIEDGALRQTMGDRARAEVSSRSWDAATQRLLDQWQTQIAAKT